MAAPHRTTVGRIATKVATDIDGTVENLPVVVEALDHPDRAVRLTAMWALVVVTEFRPETADGVVAQAKSRAAVEAQFVVDVLTDSERLAPDEPGPATTNAVGPEDVRPDPVDDALEATPADVAAGVPGAREEPTDEPRRDARVSEAPLQLAPEAREVVKTVVEEMWKAPQRTPSLLRLLAHDRRHVRLTAMWAVALVADHHPTNVDHLAARAQQHDSRETEFLVDMLDYYHDVTTADTGRVDVTLAPPEEQLDGTLWGPYITYPTVEDRVVGEQSNTFTPDSSVLQAVSSIEIVGLSHYERVYVAAGTVDNEYTKFNIHTYVPEGRYATKDFQRDFQPAIDDWTAVDGLENVAAVHDYGRSPHPWVTTDYLPRPLWEAGRLPPVTAVETAIELCDAVATMHQGGTAHGAVSPWSIGIVQTAAAYVPKLTRVGVAANLGGPRTLRIDERYAPPEAMSEEYGSVGRLSDVYGLGATLYTMLTGDAPPYPRDLDGGFVPVDVPDPTMTVSNLPTELDQIVQTATATEKPWRYESATRLGQELRGLVEESE
ncbi:hypothetical protein [Halobaculum sp. MBLA0143]|uniref:hypothetical protein n=1 Tax=Halobaculum sp. MBLA0143 TaxID=3079933 RepID=UPI003523B2F5